MSEPTADENADHIEQAMSEVQRLEREERAADMERLRRADDGIVDALSSREHRDD